MREEKAKSITINVLIGLLPFSTNLSSTQTIITQVEKKSFLHDLTVITEKCSVCLVSLIKVKASLITTINIGNKSDDK